MFFFSFSSPSEISNHGHTKKSTVLSITKVLSCFSGAAVPRHWERQLFSSSFAPQVLFTSPILHISPQSKSLTAGEKCHLNSLWKGKVTACLSWLKWQQPHLQLCICSPADPIRLNPRLQVPSQWRTTSVFVELITLNYFTAFIPSILTLAESIWKFVLLSLITLWFIYEWLLAHFSTSDHHEFQHIFFLT